MGLFSPIIREHLRNIASMARGRLLDVGCGNKPYRELFTNVTEYVGMEISATPMPGRPHSDARAITADFYGLAENLPVPDASFDVVMATQVIEHLREPALFFEEAARVLQPGGLLILTFPLFNPLHEEPFDFYRFTHYAVRDLCARFSMKVEVERKMGGGWLTVGYLMRLMLGADVDAGERTLRARMRLMLGTRLYEWLKWYDRKDPREEAPSHYLVAARKVAATAS